MAIEIEHKYLVKDLSFRQLATRVYEIQQGYLNKDPERTVRIRIRDEKAYLTVKGKTSGDTRQEYEFEIDKGVAEEMLKLALPGIIVKRRYIVPFDGFIWEIDEFLGSRKGLIVAEVEIPSSDTSYSIPPFIGEEVTHDPSYFNSNL